jgi:hypothetical protein
MAKVKDCNLALIDKLGPDVDFYYWKNILCVRMMPKKVRQPGTPDQKDTWRALRYANDEYNLLGQNERDAYKYLAAPSQMSGRDLFIKMVLQNWKEYGPNYNHSRIRFLDHSPDYYRIGFFKNTGCSVTVCGMTSEQVPRVCQWREIGVTLRGKRMLRRWNLFLHPENATTQGGMGQHESNIYYGRELPNTELYWIMIAPKHGVHRFGFSGLYRFDPANP